MKVRWLIAIVAAVAAVVVLSYAPAVRLMVSGGDSEQSASGSGGASGGSGATCGPDAQAAKMDFTLKDMDGKDLRMADYKGKVVLINFWATWCPPCKAEIPEFVEIRKKYHDRGFEILGISVDDPQEELRPFAERFRVNYPLLVGADRDDVQEAFGPVFGVPQSILISRDSKVCRKFIGPVSGTSLERALTPLL